MGEILGLGMTHYPGMTMQGSLAGRSKSFMKDPLLPEAFKNPETWPEPMRKEWSNDEGQAHSDEHRRILTENFRWVRKELDAFNPDVVLIWGDDQYENFKEDIVPPFAILAYPEFDAKPWGHLPPGRKNSWDEPPETEFHYKGHAAGRQVPDESGCWRTASRWRTATSRTTKAWAHAFLNTALYLDWDRKGLPYPLLPVATNCYGRALTKLHGGVLNNLG